MLDSSSSSKITTDQIKQGLERIKRAQEQVLQELRKNQISEIQANNFRQSAAAVYRNTSQMYKLKTQEADHMYKQLREERRKSTQKSQLYGRRITDLQTSLNSHEQNELILKRQISSLKKQLEKIREENRSLEQNNERLLQQSQRSRQLRRKQDMKLVNLSSLERQHEQLKIQCAQIYSQKQAILSERNEIAKKNMSLQSQNQRIKEHFANLEENIQNLEMRISNGAHLSLNQDGKISNTLLHRLIQEINKSNQFHEEMYQSIRNKSKAELLLEDNYQTSFNAILQILEKIQVSDDKYTSIEDAGEIKKQIQSIYQDKIMKLSQDNSELNHNLNLKQEKFTKLQNEKEGVLEQLRALQKSNDDHQQQINEKNMTILKLQQSLQKQAHLQKSSTQKIALQKQAEYQTIIQELNEQMLQIKRQKVDLNEVISKINSSKNEESMKLMQKLEEMLSLNAIIKQQNENIRSRYDCLSVEKQHVEFKVKMSENKIQELNDRISREIQSHQELRNRYQQVVNSIKQKNGQIERSRKIIDDLNLALQEGKENKQREREDATRKLMELRKQIEHALAQRQQLQGLRIRYDKLLKDNRFLGQMALQNNVKISHLWEIKEVEYMNLNKIIAELKPSLGR